jgi:cell division transport system ATP-binding protein
VIHFQHVTKSYGPQTVALRDVSLHVGRGEFVLLTGPSGAGKTTLLRTVFAAERPDSGKVLVAGRDISRLRRSAIPYLRRNVGVVFQDFKLLWPRTAFENVAIPLAIRGEAAKAMNRKVFAALEAVGLSHLREVPVRCLSGGEQQRVAIARAVVAAPVILLADEPTGNLDPERSNDILDLLGQVHAGGTTILIATHDPQVIRSTSATRLVSLGAGELRHDATPLAQEDVPTDRAEPRDCRKIPAQPTLDLLGQPGARHAGYLS